MTPITSALESVNQQAQPKFLSFPAEPAATSDGRLTPNRGATSATTS